MLVIFLLDLGMLAESREPATPTIGLSPEMDVEEMLSSMVLAPSTPYKTNESKAMWMYRNVQVSTI